MEPPISNDWDPDLYKKNPDYAKKLKKELYHWLNTMVREIAPKIEQDTFELPGMENILPSLSREEMPVEEVDINYKDEKINSINIVKKSMSPPKKSPKKPTKPKKPRIKRKPKPNPKPPKDEETKARIRSIRAFCFDPNNGLYRVVMNPSKTGKAFIEVNLVGESLTDKAVIQSAKNERTGDVIAIEGNVLGPIAVSDLSATMLTLTLRAT